MGKSKKTAKKGGRSKRTGPYLAAAFFCQVTLEDKEDGSISAIRMVDKLGVVLAPDTPPDVPSQQKPLPVNVAGLVAFKTGDAPGGEHTLRLVMRSPSGKKSPPLEQKVIFSPEPFGGANIRMKHTFYVSEGGVFWLDVSLDGRPVTRMPIEISIQRGQALQTEIAGQSQG